MKTKIVTVSTYNDDSYDKTFITNLILENLSLYM